MAARKKKISLIARLGILIVLAIVLGASLLFERQINNALNLIIYDESEYGGYQIAEVVDVSDSEASLKVHFIDVGQGDACVVELPDGKKMIIDGGKDKEKQKLLSYIDDTVDPDDTMLAKKNSGGYGFDYAVLTHADEDHCGGMDDVLEQYKAEVFYRPGELASYKTYSDPGKDTLPEDAGAQSTLAYMRAIDSGYKTSKNVYINGFESAVIRSEAGAENTAEYYEIIFYTPLSASYTDRNDYSPIIIINFQGKKIALSGDAEKRAEEEFAAAAQKGEDKFSVFNDAYSVDVIKLGHHGSRTSSSQGYLDAITAPGNIQNIIAVISCGTDNSYGHPHPETIERLKNMGITDEHILRTDTLSTIALKVSGGEVLYGADVVITAKPALAVGSVHIAWRELAITVFILCAILLLFKPAKKAVKRRSAPQSAKGGKNKGGSAKNNTAVKKGGTAKKGGAAPPPKNTQNKKK